MLMQGAAPLLTLQQLLKLQTPNQVVETSFRAKADDMIASLASAKPGQGPDAQPDAPPHAPASVANSSGAMLSVACMYGVVARRTTEK